MRGRADSVGAVSERGVPTADPSCVFCRIVAGEADAHVVFRDEVAMAFLDVRPLFPGHTLLVPLEHHETLADLPTPDVGPFFERAQRLSRMMESTLGAKGSFVALNNRISQSVPHLHVHVVPRRPKDGLRGFFWPRTKYSSGDEAASYAKLLAEGWNPAEG
jgi:histidine triad (HIT) family protein